MAGKIHNTRQMAALHILVGDRVHVDGVEATVTDRRCHVLDDGLHTTLDLADDDGHKSYVKKFGPRDRVDVVQVRSDLDGETWEVAQ